MDSIAEASVEEGLTATIGTVAIVCEVDVSQDDTSDEGRTAILYRCSDPRQWVQLGFFSAAIDAVEEIEGDEED